MKKIVVTVRPEDVIDRGINAIGKIDNTYYPYQVIPCAPGEISEIGFGSPAGVRRLEFINENGSRETVSVSEGQVVCIKGREVFIDGKAIKNRFVRIAP